MSFPPNLHIPGYELIRLLGEGGMASVYLAMQKSLDRKVAIKILRTHHDSDPEATVKRFTREGKTLAKIAHRNVCGVYDVGQVDDVAFIAMEYLEGGTLVDRQRTGIPIAEAIAIVVQLANALQEAHDQGIVHRDLKPANVMMRGGKVPVLSDFGIARELTSHHTRITSENTIVGTPVYMSPEQVTGGEIDGRSDLYSLGIMFYELLTGSVPYQADQPIQVCMQHLTAPLPMLPNDLDDLNPIISQMLAKRRDDRFDNMIDFSFALRRVIVDSADLRIKAELMPDQPWTEQLRALGFSLDTLRDADLRARLHQQVAAHAVIAKTDSSPNSQSGTLVMSTQSTGASSASQLASDQASEKALYASAVSQAVPSALAQYPSRSQTARDVAQDESIGQSEIGQSNTQRLRQESDRAINAVAKPTKRAWLWGLLAAAIIMLGAGGGYLAYTQRAPSKQTLLALKALARDFEGHVQRGELFQPAGSNAASDIRDMLEIKPTSKIAKSRTRQLAQAVQAKVLTLAQSEQLEQANALIADAERAALFDAPALTAMRNVLLDVRRQKQAQAQFPARLLDAETALRDSPAAQDWPKIVRGLREAAAPDDIRLEKFLRTLEASFLAQTEIAIQNTNWQTAQTLIAGWELIVAPNAKPDSKLGRAASKYAEEIQTYLAKSTDPITRLQTLTAALQSAPTQTQELARWRLELEWLALFNLPAKALSETQAKLVRVADQHITRLAQADDLVAARSFLAALGRASQTTKDSQPADVALAAASAAIAQAEQRARDRLNLGEFQITSTEPATVTGIYLNDTQAMPLPSHPATPITLTLAPGLYRVELTNASGSKRSIAASFKAGVVEKVLADFSRVNDPSVEEEEVE